MSILSKIPVTVHALTSNTLYDAQNTREHQSYVN